MSRPHIGVGPKTTRPSWSWVGADTALELGRHFTVTQFKARELPRCDLVLWVKQPLDLRSLETFARRRTRVVYCPIDHYESMEQIRRDRRLLGQCAAVIVHCERLVPVFRRLGLRAECVEHHNRFGLPSMTDHKASGPVLWVGTWPQAEHVCRSLRQHPIANPALLLTEKPAQVQQFVRKFSLAGQCQVRKWTAEVQRSALESCRAAIDVKGSTFGQLHKPPTKAQKYICSGVPFATNRESYASEYFLKRGFELAEPSDPDRWFSKEYWTQTHEVGIELRNELTLEAVGRRYKRIVDTLLDQRR